MPFDKGSKVECKSKGYVPESTAKDWECNLNKLAFQTCVQSVSGLNTLASGRIFTGQICIWWTHLASNATPVRNYETLDAYNYAVCALVLKVKCHNIDS